MLKTSQEEIQARLDQLYAESLDMPLVRLSQFDIAGNALENVRLIFQGGMNLFHCVCIGIVLWFAMAHPPPTLKPWNLLHFISNHLIRPVYAL